MNLCIDDLMDRVLEAQDRENKKKIAYVGKAFGNELPEVRESIERLEDQLKCAADRGELCGEFKIEPLHAFVLMWEFRSLRPVVRVCPKTLDVTLDMCWNEDCCEEGTCPMG